MAPGDEGLAEVLGVRGTVGVGSLKSVVLRNC